MIKFGHARAQINLKLTFKWLSCRYLPVYILQYFEKQLLKRTLMNDSLSKLLTTRDRKRYSICVNTLLGLQA